MDTMGPGSSWDLSGLSAWRGCISPTGSYAEYGDCNRLFGSIAVLAALIFTSCVAEAPALSGNLRLNGADFRIAVSF